MKTLLILLLASVPAYAGQVEWNNQTLAYSDEFSFKNYADRMEVSFPRGTTVYASVFYRESPDSNVFLSTMTGVTFVECNLDNVVLPVGNELKNVYRPSKRRFFVQNDWRDWILNDSNEPVELIDKDYWLELEYSTRPADIPTRRIRDWNEVPRVQQQVIIE